MVPLPCDHEGGQLAVRNAGNEIVFDWSESANTADLKPCIKWATFYSDCQHEVLQVTSGHRITLTYNLYVTRGLGHLAGAAKVLDATTLPLYKTIQTALEKRNFFLNGHVIAIWLTHAYAHSTKNNNFLPASLKGADMSLYETAIALGLRCQVVPVIPNGGYSYGEDGQVDIYEPGNFGPLVTGQIYEGEGNTWGRPMPTVRYTWVNRRKKDMDDAQAAYVAVSIILESGFRASVANMICSLATISVLTSDSRRYKIINQTQAPKVAYRGQINVSVTRCAKVVDLRASSEVTKLVPT